MYSLFKVLISQDGNIILSFKGCNYGLVYWSLEGEGKPESVVSQ